jgi:hypothetical protein
MPDTHAGDIGYRSGWPARQQAYPDANIPGAGGLVAG